MTLLRHLVSVVVLPVTVAVLVSTGILAGDAGWERALALGSHAAVVSTVLGAAVILAGLSLVVVTVAHFARLGHGTLAPWDPPQRLVVAGVYRHVRNPMISGVVLILVGEAILFRSVGIAMWAGSFAVGNAVYIPAVEEPGLARRFGDEYVEYTRHVPRWVPRLRPWTPDSHANTNASVP